MTSDTVLIPAAENTLQGDVDNRLKAQGSQAGMEDHKEYFWDVVRFKVCCFPVNIKSKVAQRRE
jgi:hypothetical protein